MFASNQFKFKVSEFRASSISFGSIVIILKSFTIFFIFLAKISLCLWETNLESFTPMTLNFGIFSSSTIIPAIINGPMTGPFGEFKLF